MSDVKYIENSFHSREWNELEDCITALLTPYHDVGIGDLEYMREEIDHMRNCMARFIAGRGPTTDVLERTFNVSISIVENTDG